MYHLALVRRAMGQNFSCAGRDGTSLEPVHEGRTSEPGPYLHEDVDVSLSQGKSLVLDPTDTDGHSLGMESDITRLGEWMRSMEMDNLQGNLRHMRAADPAMRQSRQDANPSVTESDIHRLHVAVLSMESVMEDLRGQLKRMSDGDAVLHESNKDASRTGAATHNPGIEADIRGGSAQGVFEALHKLQDLRDELRWNSLVAMDPEPNFELKQWDQEAVYEEWRKFEILVEHYREVDQHSSTSEGSTATSVQDADSSAGSDLAWEDSFDARLNPCEVSVGAGSDDATVHIAPPLKEPCVFFQMSPRFPPLEVLDCPLTGRSNISLEVLDCQMTPRCNEPPEALT